MSLVYHDREFQNQWPHYFSLHQRHIYMPGYQSLFNFLCLVGICRYLYYILMCQLLYPWFYCRDYIIYLTQGISTHKQNSGLSSIFPAFTNCATSNGSDSLSNLKVNPFSVTSFHWTSKLHSVVVLWSIRLSERVFVHF